MRKKSNGFKLSSFLDLISIGKFRKISILLIIIGILTIHPKVQGFNDASRMATIQAIVENHSLSIDQSDFSEGFDKVFINGKFYSDKPVFTALFGAVVYYPLYLMGIELGLGWNLAYYLITLFTVKLFWYVGLKAYYAILARMGLKDNDRLLMTLALGIGSLYFTWSATFTNHVLSASLMMVGFYFFLDEKKHESPFGNFFLAGFFFSLAGVQDLAILTFYAGFGIYILAEKVPWRAKLGYFVPLLITLLPTLWINYAISGSILPFGVVESYFIYDGSPWLESNLLTGMEMKGGWKLVSYSFHSLIGKKSFLLHNPLSLLALPMMVEEIRTRGKYSKQALVIGISSMVVVIYYLLFSQDFSGFAYSIRWFVPFLPLWYFFLYRIFVNDRPRWQKTFSYLFLASVVIASVGLVDPWTTVVTGVPFFDNLITIMIGV